jgi:hypothetical protein
VTAGDGDRDAAQAWFLERGLPAALTARNRSRHLLPRSSPGLAGYATIVVALLVVFLVTGSSEVYIDGAPTPAETVVLGVIVLVVPLALVVGRVVSRIQSRRTQSIVSVGSVAVAACASVFQGGLGELPATVVAVVIVLVATATGIGAVLGWALRLTVTQLSAMGALFVSALPVMLLTVVVFFNGYVWILASTISQSRLFLALFFLFSVTAAFIVSSSRSRVRPMLESVGTPHGADHDLSGTPFATMPDRPAPDPLTPGERFNVILVMATTQIAHLLVVAICTASIFFVLGLIVLSPELLAKWSGGGPSDGAILGVTLPVPQSLIHMTLILCALTFMYVSARSVGDDEYRRDFLDPLIEDLHTTLIARNRYRV